MWPQVLSLGLGLHPQSLGPCIGLECLVLGLEPPVFVTIPAYYSNDVVLGLFPVDVHICHFIAPCRVHNCLEITRRNQTRSTSVPVSCKPVAEMYVEVDNIQVIMQDCKRDIPRRGGRQLDAGGCRTRASSDESSAWPSFRFTSWQTKCKQKITPVSA